MKKIMILIIGILLMATSVVTATSYTVLKEKTITGNGTFDANIGPRPNGNQTIGTITGTYELRNRGGRFTGDWEVSAQNKSASGTIRGFFGKHFILGKITISQTNRSLPIIGFLVIRNETFLGRFMAPVGPALYFWGTHT
jgi:hypothetical protein